MGWLDKLIPKCKTVSRKAVNLNKTALILRASRLEKSLAANRDKYGWVLDDCDAMLYQGLFGAVKKNKADVFHAMDKSGKAYRTPKKDCFKTGNSKSSWSRDMGIGLMWWCYRADNRLALNRHFKYGQKHKWIMGEGVIARTFYNPLFVGLFDQVRFKANKRKYPDWKKNLYLFPKVKNYEAHLQVLIIALLGEMNGKIPQKAFDRLKEHHKRKPNNPLFACVYAKFKGGNIDFISRVLENPIIDDYAGGKGSDIKKAIDLLFAVDYLVR